MKQYKEIDTSSYTFEDTIKGDYLYVDKTDYFYKLVKKHKGIFFMSRPRRFGKSLSVSILKNIFNGNKELFKGLKIYDTDYNWQPYPVIHFNIAEANCGSIELLHRSLCLMMHRSATELQLSLSDEPNSALLFAELIGKTADKKRGELVILIDEYDKPLTESIDYDHAGQIRQVMSDFYLNIKNFDRHLRFVFMTGVTKFSKVSVFSTLNNLNDISIDADYACMYGYTQDELDQYFGDQISDLAVQQQQDPVVFREKIREWYNGFLFNADAKTVYNPVSIGSFINERGVFRHYWFTTGNSSFLMKILNRNDFDIFDVRKPVSKSSLDAFDLSNITPAPILLQSGYLTIDRTEMIVGELHYHLRFPNKDIESAFELYFLEFFSGRPVIDVSETITDMKRALVADDTKTLRKLIESHLAAIPFGWIAHIEKNYQTILFSMFRLLGAKIENEVNINTGRIDAVIINATHVYIFEFKIKQSATKAIAQIKEMNYARPYKTSGKMIKLIGISFSEKKRNISGWKEELVSD